MGSLLYITGLSFLSSHELDSFAPHLRVFEECRSLAMLTVDRVPRVGKESAVINT